ncbi:glycosyltransferase [Dankookia rubra]|uniref:Glycosyltransferase n=1 Tax=Dankookia rubra TaxID=1442381 RepID=A0A4R5Q6H6_9PROT|nr:WecB/TagA/CpsF family glycosyltransferase [Dankookia rubra]TDH58464.1 glycosyltransferase [Dankookia rubra]
MTVLSSAESIAEVARLNVLGVDVSVINPALALDTIRRWIEGHERRYVCVTGVHGIMESHRNETIRRIHNQAGLVTPDGMPLVWLLRLAGNRDVSRVYGPDLMLSVLECSQDLGWRHYLYGASTETLFALRSEITRRFPGAVIAGSYSPPFRPLSASEDAEIISAINGSAADIVWVGLSTPKQELWMAEHREKLNAAVLIGVGAAFDFHAGRIRQAPKFMQRSGLEWLFRLILEPRRLYKRYLVNNPAFIFLLLVQKARSRRRQT